MTLRDILENVEGTLVQGSLDIDIENIVINSKLAKENVLFVASHKKMLER